MTLLILNFILILLVFLSMLKAYLMQDKKHSLVLFSFSWCLIGVLNLYWSIPDLFYLISNGVDSIQRGTSKVASTVFCLMWGIIIIVTAIYYYKTKKYWPYLFLKIMSILAVTMTILSIGMMTLGFLLNVVHKSDGVVLQTYIISAVSMFLVLLYGRISYVYLYNRKEEYKKKNSTREIFLTRHPSQEI
jgi:hypothetical protein